VPTQGQRRCLTAAVLAGVAGLSNATTARAGAWLREPGETQIIFSGAAMQASRRFDRGGRPLRAGRFSKQELQVSAEHGVSGGLTLLAGASARSIAFVGASGMERSGSGALLAGARARLWAEGASSLSVQGSASAGGERSLPGRMRALEAPAEADLRLLYGRSFAIGGTPIFAEAQVGYRWRGGSNADELRIDANFGVRPVPTVLLLLQSFNAIAIQQDRRFGGGRLRQHKVQPSLVWDFADNWSLQVGAYASLGGRETLQERGALAALWWRF